MKVEGHLEAYRQFRESYIRDLERGEALIKPIAQNALMLAFHLIEAVLAMDGQHVNKHQQLPRFLRSTPSTVLTESERQELARLYETLEMLRPARVYGSKGNGEALRRIRETVERIERICLRYVEVDSSAAQGSGGGVR